MTKAVELNFEMRRGDAWEGATFDFPVSVGPSFWNNVSVRSQMRCPNGNAMVEFNITPVVTTGGGGEGILSFHLSLNETEAANLVPGIGLGDIQIKSTALPATTFVTYKAQIFPDQTR